MVVNINSLRKDDQFPPAEIHMVLDLASTPSIFSLMSHFIPMKWQYINALIVIYPKDFASIFSSWMNLPVGCHI